MRIIHLEILYSSHYIIPNKDRFEEPQEPVLSVQGAKCKAQFVGRRCAGLHRAQRGCGAGCGTLFGVKVLRFVEAGCANECRNRSGDEFGDCEEGLGEGVALKPLRLSSFRR